MANYQYETSPRKIQPEYQKRNISKKPKKQNKKLTKKAKKKFKLSFELKFFINSMLFFSIIFAIVACQAAVNQKYKEKERLKQQYDELLSNRTVNSDWNQDIRVIASDYGMQTKSATLIDLGTSDYIESSVENEEIEKEGFFEKILNWIKENL